MDTRQRLIRELISALMLSEFYFELTLRERLRLVHRLVRGVG